MYDKLSARKDNDMFKAFFLRDELQRRSVDSIKTLVPGKFYSMEYFSDYHLDEAVALNPETIEDFNAFAAKYLLNIPFGNQPLESVGSGCSVFAGHNSEGQQLLARNYDYSHDITGMMIKCHPKKGYKSMGMCDLAFIGMPEGALENHEADFSSLMIAPFIMVDGVNEKGVGVAVLEIDRKGTYPENSGKPKLCTTFVPRMILDGAASVGEAIDMLSQYDIISPIPEYCFHFLITDTTGVCKVVETVQGDMKVYDASCVANEFLTPYYMVDPEEPRYNIMKEYLKHRNGMFSEEEAFAVLRTVHMDKTIGVGMSITRWSSVFNLAHRTIDLCYDRDFDKTFHFEL